MYSVHHPFSRSYGVILPNSLTMLLPSALGSSPHPPVSVYGTGSTYAIAAFLGGSYACFATLFSLLRPLRIPQLATAASLRFLPVFSFPAHASSPRPRSSDMYWCRNLNLLSIDYVFRPRLRSRLTQGRSALLWNP